MPESKKDKKVRHRPHGTGNHQTVQHAVPALPQRKEPGYGHDCDTAYDNNETAIRNLNDTGLIDALIKNTKLQYEI